MAGYHKRIDEVTAAAREIIDAETKDRDAKTARLREDRMAARAGLDRE